MLYPENMPAWPNEAKDEPVKIPLDPEAALRGLLAVRAGHSVHEGQSLTTQKCEGCGAVMTEVRKVKGKLFTYCPNDPNVP